MNQKYLIATAQGQEQNVALCITANAQNIASFLTQYREAPFISIDTLHDFPFLTARYGFVDTCYDQQYLIHHLLPALNPMQLEDVKAPELTFLTNPSDLLGYEAPKPDWNCLMDYGITDEEYNVMDMQIDESEDNEL
ncbi:hypothetical protein FRY98_03635 [Paenibacillus faecis]|uniref:Uncharacterized protein n=1 Tax=Paenibacillus faecis TaxID=862114 RepID=A0A5D0CXL6_9BACL|nr:hypothetical protein [Paenibacillus faecis]TYA14779.1 hypothetical protein FRY98_03635 [Paenibacillus faecis]